MRASLACAALPLLAGPNLACAETPGSNLDSVIVTATRTAESISQSLAPVTLLTRSDIERSQARDVQELLTGLPGVQIANSGGRGKSTSLFLRGTNSDHVLVLIDGIKVGSATSGTTAFEQLPIDQIERIEIVRGPRSSLYGSEAIGGVVQIFTRRIHGQVLLPSFSSAAGSADTGQLQAGLSGAGERVWYNLSLSALETKGIDARPSLRQPDQDGYQSISGSARGGWRFGNDGELSLNWLRVEGENEFDGTSQNNSQNTQQVFGTTMGFNPLERWRTAVTAGRGLDVSENYFDDSFRTRFETSRDSVSWQNDMSIAAEQLGIVGLDYQNDEIDSTTSYRIGSRNNLGGFAQYRGRFGGHEVELSVRRDRNEQFGAHTTHGAAWGYRFASGLRLTASHGSAFKAPTFNQLYFPGFGNPDLEPEESRSTEIGLGARTGVWNWAVNAYETEIKNLIVNVSTPAGLLPVNVGEARIRGVEAQCGVRAAAWRMQSYLTLLEPRDGSGGANDGNLLPRRAKQSGHLDVDGEFGPLNLGVTLNAVGERFDDASNTVRLGGYGTVDLRTEYRLAAKWLLQGQAANLFDKRYASVATYAQPGRTFLVTLRYTPGAP